MIKFCCASDIVWILDICFGIKVLYTKWQWQHKYLVGNRFLIFSRIGNLWICRSIVEKKIWKKINHYLKIDQRWQLSLNTYTLCAYTALLCTYRTWCVPKSPLLVHLESCSKCWKGVSNGIISVLPVFTSLNMNLWFHDLRVTWNGYHNNRFSFVFNRK